MRSNVNTTVVSRNVFGFGQDRVVSQWNDSYAHAAQHLELRHASKRARVLARRLKRGGITAAAGEAPPATATCRAMSGPLRSAMRPESLAVVLS